ncbi:hypothetical protein [Peribacillus butanolivorans]|uniref:Uncharacterized protein n=1 Tax=Peribacillus butanolivorans TaxID=421767 RepID=A0AAX0S989_9BACI|nr:hypothetical protein [Peribacillus butanolivorans]PEJ37524.1 hypothetical protein CN689_01100 [Peribacillus butanolivorans]QNU04895.1 hypothetical protein GM240_13810 [Peribacillus butanolivorans]
MLSVLEVIQNGIVEENDETKLNVYYVKEYGLSNTEINNLQQALIEISSDDLSEIESETRLLEKEILIQDDVIQIGELTAYAAGRHAAPPCIGKNFKNCIWNLCRVDCCYLNCSRHV